jgi:5-methylcytosine-specific restriction endonuclease McrA
MSQEGFLLATNPVPTYSPDGTGEEGWAFEIVYDEVDPVSFELSESFLTYVLKFAICAECLETIGNTAHLRTCDKSARSDSNWSRTRYRYCFIAALNEPEFRKRWGREKQRYRERVRKYKLRKIPLPSEEILIELRNQQGNHCYYCFVEFDHLSSDVKPHIDHFDSVANGGSNSIFNLVYACPKCNRAKFKEDGAEFLNKWFPDRSIPAALKSEIKRMRASVTERKEQFAPKNLAKVERLVGEHRQRIPGPDSIEFDEWCREGLQLFHRLEQIKREAAKMTRTNK